MKIKIVLLLSLIYGCSSNMTNSPVVLDESDLEDKVISRIDEMSSRPGWLKESESFKVSEGNVVSLGSTTIPGDHRLDAAIRIAFSNAKSGICSAIEQRLDYIFQNAQEGTTLDANQTRYIGAEACKMTTSSLRNGNIYWEKVLSRKISGEHFMQYRVFATVNMSEVELKAAIHEAINKRAGLRGLTKDFSKKVDKHWDDFTKSASVEENNEALNKATPQSIQKEIQ